MKKHRPPTPAKPATRVPLWTLAGALALATLFVYSPALGGPFLFDDLGTPAAQEIADASWPRLIAGQRGVANFTYWLQHVSGASGPLASHLVSLVFHIFNGLLAGYLVRRVLFLAGRSGPTSDLAALFCSGLFLLHPLQTEAAAYIASRSEPLCVFFAYSAIALFLHRFPGPTGWRRALEITALSGLAVGSKEPAIALPAAFLLTAMWWGPDSPAARIRRGWRLYLLVGAGGAAAGVLFFRELLVNPTVGFTLHGVTWYSYFWTQCEALWVYLRLFVLPVQQNLDHAFPVASAFTQPGVLLGLVGLLTVSAAAWRWRLRFPLASFGWFVFLALLAPSSSFIPIADTLAERRLYLPMLGLLLVAAEFITRTGTVRGRVAAPLAAILLASGVLTYQRSTLYRNAIAMWSDSVAANPANGRAWFHLAFAYYETGRCAESVRTYEQAAARQRPDDRLLIDWALALDCDNQPRQAIERLEEALRLSPTAHAWATLGMLHAKQQRDVEALAALEKASALDPRYELPHIYRGNIFLRAGDLARAEAEFRRALALNPTSGMARQGLDATLRARQRR